MQIVEYAAIPNTREHDYIATITKLLGEIQRQDLAFKEFRDWLKEQAIWDKEVWPVVWHLLDIKAGERIFLGEFAKKLAALSDEGEMRQQLFLRIVKRNEILFKYVFEALDERLHSTHELYRLITSYVYPGEYITLVNFQNWIKWMAALGHIKFIGIRWGLTDQGRGELQRAKMIDVEELLEDERLERESGDRGDGDDADAAPVEVSALADSASTASETAGSETDPTSQEEDLPDMPPSPVVPALRRADEEGPAPRVAASAPRRPAEAIPQMAPRRFVIPEVSRDDLAANAEKIKGWWAGFADKKAYQLNDFGVDAGEYEKNKALFLFKAACIGRLIAFDDLSAIYYPYVNELNSRRFFERLWAEEPVGMLLGEADFFSQNPWYLKATELLVYFLAYRHRLKGDDGLVEACETARNGQELIRTLGTRLYGGALTLEPFWLVRELTRLGLWTNPSFEAVAIVPTYGVRMNMFRLGFLSTMYVDQLGQLIDASEALSRYFGSEDNFEAPLAQFGDAHGCAFKCNRVNTCPFACREKFNV